MKTRAPINHTCKLCGADFVSTHPRHFYCETCSTSQDLKRKRLDGVKVYEDRKRDAARDVGREISASNAVGLHEMIQPVELAWFVRVGIPFSWSGSKNAIYTLRAKGHVALRREAKAYRAALIYELQAALRGRKIVQNKLWVEIFVEKANHKRDAANFVDTVCDAVKVATGLDDRWFSIRRVDWSINKAEPFLMVGIGQEKVNDCQVCSYCGRILEFDHFHNNRSNKSGKSRVCKDCDKAAA